jgi:hypothetical protein
MIILIVLRQIIFQTMNWKAFLVQTFSEAVPRRSKQLWLAWWSLFSEQRITLLLLSPWWSSSTAWRDLRSKLSQCSNRCLRVPISLQLFRMVECCLELGNGSLLFSNWRPDGPRHWTFFPMSLLRPGHWSDISS